MAASPIAHDPSLPPINVDLCEGEFDLVFRVSDNGGGMKSGVFENIFTHKAYRGDAFKMKPEFQAGMISYVYVTFHEIKYFLESQP